MCPVCRDSRRFEIWALFVAQSEAVNELSMMFAQYWKLESELKNLKHTTCLMFAKRFLLLKIQKPSFQTAPPQGLYFLNVNFENKLGQTE